MDRKRLFDLLQLPMVRTPGGDLVVFEDKRTVRHVSLHGTELQIRDIATRQARQPWVLTATELFLLTEGGNRELAFELGRIAAPLGSGHFYTALIEADPGSTSGGASYFLLNARNGAWPLQLRGQELLALTKEPMPFLGSWGWRQEETVCYGGMTPRPAAQHTTPGKPAVASFRPAAISNGRVPHTIELLPVSPQWENTLQRYSLSPRQIKQLAPECCIAVAAKHGAGAVLVGLLALPFGEDPLDELSVVPLNSEYLGYILMSLDGGTVSASAVFRHILATLPADNGMTWAFVIDNRGKGGAVQSLSRLDFDSTGVYPERSVTLTHADPEAACVKFRAHQHPKVGYIAVAELRSHDPKPVAHYLQSDDGLNWNVVGREGEIEGLGAG